MTPDETAPRMRLWKRIVLIGLSIGVGLVIAGTAVGLGFYWYYNHARPTRNWPEVEVAQENLKAQLSTKWRNGQLNYLLTLSPKSPSLVDSFDAALRAQTAPFGLTILLNDSSGFRLCSISVEDGKFTREVDDKGKFESLSVNDSAFECSYGDYSDASTWTITWQNLPNAAPDIPDSGYKLIPPPATAAPKHHTSAIPSVPMEGTDTLSGVDAVEGQLDTASGHVFDIFLSGEKYTILTWSAGTEIKFNCKTPSNCTIVNSETQETVHAHLEK